MTKEKEVVLALFPNSLGFGYAVMESPLDVIEAQMIVIRPRPVCNSKTLTRMKALIDYYQPDVLIIEDPLGTGSRKYPRIQKLLGDISAHGEEHKLEVFRYTREQIRFVFSNFNARSKHEIASIIATNIPMMKAKLMEKRKAWESEAYHMGAFDAVALAMTHYYMH